MVFTKWGGARHWEYDAVRLGADRHGVWIGSPSGTSMARPGASFVAAYDHVGLVPAGGYVANFSEDVPAAPFSVYVDICTPPRWVGAVVTTVDLDLDVIRDRAGRVWVDDEDEFAEHRVRLGYPDVVAERAVGSCADVLRAVEAGEPPYDGATALHWLDVLAGLR
jgi:hypothetical protein